MKQLTGYFYRQGIVLERPSSPSEEEPPRCKVCGQLLSNWQPGMPLICPDHNPNRQGTKRDGQQGPRVVFDEWIQGTLWYVAAP